MATLPSEILPSVWSLLYARLKDKSARAETRGDLVEQVRLWATREHASRSLSALEQCGVIVGDESGVRLAVECATEADFRKLVLDKYLTIPNSGVAQIWKDRTSDGEGQQLALQAEASIGWLMLQGVVRPMSQTFNNGPETLLAKQVPAGADRPFLRNNTTYDSMVRLAIWLGLAAGVVGPTGDPCLVPLPALAISRVLAHEFVMDEALPAHEFLEKLYKALPWIAGAQVGRASASQFKSAPEAATPDGQVAASVATALDYLQVRKILQMEVTNDPGQGRTTFNLPQGQKYVGTINFRGGSLS
ncbi:MAG: hypothetical protein P8J33_17650 [Pirellulaceae bacterium]|nr:hypothetical protein [Pirellulaceae bacterium]